MTHFDTTQHFDIALSAWVASPPTQSLAGRNTIQTGTGTLIAKPVSFNSPDLLSIRKTTTLLVV